MSRERFEELMRALHAACPGRMPVGTQNKQSKDQYLVWHRGPWENELWCVGYWLHKEEDGAGLRYRFILQHVIGGVVISSVPFEKEVTAREAFERRISTAYEEFCDRKGGIV